MPTSLVQCEVVQGVATVTLNRPDKRNALTREMLADLVQHVREIATRPEIRCLVLRARGSWFCAGMDLGQMQETAARPDAQQIWKADTQIYRQAVQSLFELSIPTIAVVAGGAMAGGLGIVLACDVVIASRDAVFALPEPKRGITAAVVTPLLLARVGLGAASYLLLSGESFEATQALQAGVCHLLTDAEQLESRASRLVEAVLSGAPQALAVTKRLLHECATGALAAQWDQAEQVSAEARQTAEAREGLAAFLEKRPPNWQRTREP
ncbi:MAG: enoyl-CoA hydratase/isomerase family protein [Planctomycetes bacterium]|nr:enoyl-CoA hydratase/isomerase family protein [Planctomycetota bacterium]